MFNHKEVIEMRLCLNKLMCCYAHSEEKKKLLSEMWKDMSSACADLIAEAPVQEKAKIKNRKGFIHKKKITLDK